MSCPGRGRPRQLPPVRRPPQPQWLTPAGVGHTETGSEGHVRATDGRVFAILTDRRCGTIGARVSVADAPYGAHYLDSLGLPLRLVTDDIMLQRTSTPSHSAPVAPEEPPLDHRGRVLDGMDRKAIRRLVARGPFAPIRSPSPVSDSDRLDNDQSHAPETRQAEAEKEEEGKAEEETEAKTTHGNHRRSDWPGAHGLDEAESDHGGLALTPQPAPASGQPSSVAATVATLVVQLSSFHAPTASVSPESASACGLRCGEWLWLLLVVVRALQVLYYKAAGAVLLRRRVRGCPWPCHWNV